MKNKKGQGGLPMNYLVILVVAVLVIGLVFYAAIRFELLDKFRGLPVGDEDTIEIEDALEVEGACPEKVGYFALPTTEGYSGSYRYLHNMDGKAIPVYKDENNLHIHEWQGFWSSLAYDNQIGSVLDFGNEYISFNCDALQIAKAEDSATTLTQKDIDNFQGSYTIPGFVQEGKQIICRNNETASKIACLKTS